MLKDPRLKRRKKRRASILNVVRQMSKSINLLTTVPRSKLPKPIPIRRVPVTEPVPSDTTWVPWINGIIAKARPQATHNPIKYIQSPYVCD